MCTGPCRCGHECRFLWRREVLGRPGATVTEGRDTPVNLGPRSRARVSERAVNSGRCSDLVGKAVMVVVTAGLAVAPAGGQAATAIVC